MGSSSNRARSCARLYLQRPPVLLLVVIDHRERDASLEIGEAGTRAPFCGILVAARHGSARRAGLHCKNRVELPEQPFDHAALMDAATIPVADADAEVLAPALEGIPFELLGQVGDQRSWSTEHRPPMLDTARDQTFILWAQRLR